MFETFDDLARRFILMAQVMGVDGEGLSTETGTILGWAWSVDQALKADQSLWDIIHPYYLAIGGNPWNELGIHYKNARERNRRWRNKTANGPVAQR